MFIKIFILLSFISLPAKADIIVCAVKVYSDNMRSEVRDMTEEFELKDMKDIMIKTKSPFSNGENVAIRVLAIKILEDSSAAVGITAYPKNDLKYDFNPETPESRQIPFSQKLQWNGHKNKEVSTAVYEAEVSCNRK